MPRSLAVFSQPTATVVQMEHDNGVTATGVPGVANGQDAHLINTTGMANGEGAWLILRHDEYGLIRQHGTLWLERPGMGEFAEFVSDVFVFTQPNPEKPVPTPPSSRRAGVVRLGGRTFVDDHGPFLGLGMTLFPLAWLWQFDRERLARILAAAALHGVDYVRALAVVGPSTSWRDRTIDPREPWWRDAIRGATDLCYDEFGVRVQWPIFGETVAAPSPADRESVVRRLLDALANRFHKVALFEVANEGYDNGFEGDAGRREMRHLASILRDYTPNLIALSAPAPDDTQLDIDRLYEGSDATVAAYHIDRNVSGTGGRWRPVRQAREGLTLFRIPWLNNEPIGPFSSGASDDDPLRIAMAAALTWQCGGPGYVLHSGFGIRAGGQHDVDRGLPGEFSTRDGEILDVINGVRSLLPLDLPNFRFANANRAFGNSYPFQNAAELQDLTDAGKLLRAFAAVSDDGRFIVTPLLATVPLPFRTRTRMTVDVINPASGEFIVTNHTVGPEETFMVPPADATIMRGRFL